VRPLIALRHHRGKNQPHARNMMVQLHGLESKMTYWFALFLPPKVRSNNTTPTSWTAAQFLLHQLTSLRAEDGVDLKRGFASTPRSPWEVPYSGHSATDRVHHGGQHLFECLRYGRALVDPPADGFEVFGGSGMEAWNISGQTISWSGWENCCANRLRVASDRKSTTCANFVDCTLKGFTSAPQRPPVISILS